MTEQLILNDNEKKFEQWIGVQFNDPSLLRQSLIHRSYVNENRGLGLDHNERLEFLGDAVLELVVTDYLFHRYPEKPEGELTSYRAALVNTTALSETANELEINDLMLLSKGEQKDTGRARSYILADAVEALIGAIYLDKGYNEASDFIYNYLIPRIDQVIERQLWIDAKSRFQEEVQADQGVTPQYEIIKESGPDHAKQFEAGVYVGDRLVARGRGDSKQEAEQDAAEKAIAKKGRE